MMEKQHWSIDKRLPLALILALLVQTAGMVWWAASLTGQVGESARRIESLEMEQRRTTEIREAGYERLTRIEEKLEAVKATGDQWRTENRERITQLERRLDEIITILRDWTPRKPEAMLSPENGGPWGHQTH
jgi:DNA repair ATPase RecN